MADDQCGCCVVFWANCRPVITCKNNDGRGSILVFTRHDRCATTVLCYKTEQLANDGQQKDGAAQESKAITDIYPIDSFLRGLKVARGKACRLDDTEIAVDRGEGDVPVVEIDGTPLSNNNLFYGC